MYLERHKVTKKLRLFDNAIRTTFMQRPDKLQARLYITLRKMRNKYIIFFRHRGYVHIDI